MGARNALLRVSFAVGVTLAILLVVIFGEPGALNMKRSGGGTLGLVLSRGAALAAVYFAFLGLRAVWRRARVAAAVGRRGVAAVMSAGTRRAQGIEWTWYKVAIAAALLHLTIMLISRHYPNPLGLLLLLPGVLFEELFARGGSRGGLTVANIASSTLFFTLLVVLFRVRRWPAVALGAAVAAGGFAAAVGNALRALGGP